MEAILEIMASKHLSDLKYEIYILKMPMFVSQTSECQSKIAVIEYFIGTTAMC